MSNLGERQSCNNSASQHSDLAPKSWPCTGSSAAPSSAAADPPRVPCGGDGGVHGSCPAAATSGGDPGRQARQGSHQGTSCRCASILLRYSKVTIIHLRTDSFQYSFEANLNINLALQNTFNDMNLLHSWISLLQDLWFVNVNIPLSAWSTPSASLLNEGASILAEGKVAGGVESAEAAAGVLQGTKRKSVPAVELVNAAPTAQPRKLVDDPAEKKRKVSVVEPASAEPQAVVQPAVHVSATEAVVKAAAARAAARALAKAAAAIAAPLVSDESESDGEERVAPERKGGNKSFFDEVILSVGAAGDRKDTRAGKTSRGTAGKADGKSSGSGVVSVIDARSNQKGGGSKEPHAKGIKAPVRAPTISGKAAVAGLRGTAVAELLTSGLGLSTLEVGSGQGTGSGWD